MVMLGAISLGAAIWMWLGSRAPKRLKSFDLRLTQSDGPPCTSPTSARDRNQKDSQRLRILAQAPVVADLLSAAVAAGASVHDAIDVVIPVVDEPVRSRLEAVRASIELGAPTTVAWVDMLDDEALAPIAGAVIRSAQTGSAISSVLDAAAVDMRQAHRSQVEIAARSAGVRAVAPLALCFLTAYLLVGVVPVIAGFAESLFG